MALFKLGGGRNTMGRVLAVLFGLAFAVIGVLFLLWILWQLWKRREEETAPPAIEIKTKAVPAVTEPEVVEAGIEAEALVAELPTVEPGTSEPAEAPTPDDLKRIGGIGPKIASVLQIAGIATFAAEVSRLEQILEEADPRLRRLTDPATWPEQAGLAAAGDWDALGALQSELKGGRRA
jgi:predicted flap endonuclease-1-like 5' DNA nuclease